MTAPFEDAAQLAVTGPQHVIAPLAHVAAEEAQRDRQATDALFLTFNVDLAYLETRLLGLCRAAGAAVTVIADADAWSPDVRSVRFAGRHYHAGLVATTHAFHPKLTLIAGPERAVAIVGSGNLTLGGWQYNAELATVLLANRTSAPRAMADLRDLLGSLSAVARLDPLSEQALSRCSRHLDELLHAADVIDTGHRLAASWGGRLIDQLPVGPVDELLLSAPFHDPAAGAVRAVLGRLQPRTVWLAVQPGWTAFEPASIASVLDAYNSATDADVRVVRDEEDPAGGRYRHGKLIEWTSGGSRRALTGSPNLSVAALLRTAGAQGNFELAVVGPVAGSLFPPGVPVNLREILGRVVQSEGASTDLGTPIITAVIDRDGGVTIHLARVRWSVEIEMSHLTDQPDRWHVVGGVVAGSETADIDLDAAGGSRIRLAWTNVDGVRGWSAVQFITDRRAALTRLGPSERRSRTQRSLPSDLWGDDPSFLSAVMGDLSAIASELAARRSGAALASRSGSAQDEHVVGSNDDHHLEPWLWIQSETLARLGPGLASYALALPSLGAIDSWVPEWIDTVVPDDVPGLDEDTADNLAETISDGPADATDPIDQRSDDEYLRTRRRTWCQNAARVAPTLPVELRLFVLRVTLRFWQAGNWQDDDLQPLRLVADLVRGLTPEDVPRQLAARVGSLSAVAVALVRGSVDLGAYNERTLLYNELARSAGRLLADAEPDVTALYLDTLVPGTKIDYWLGEIDDCRDAALSDDPFGDVDDILALDYTVARPGVRMLQLEGNLTNPAQRALEVIGQVEDRTGVAVWASNPKGDWALVVWRKPDLVTVSRTGSTRIRWRHQRLTGIVGPASLARQTRLGDSQSIYDIVTRPKFWRTDDAAAVLESVGITDPAPPVI
ncbi:hypothetical protein [Microlunatus ginsengisoli]|uniref:Phospholipase D-like domain-containing protein n=1 Tax=Microlunatus ginsengisoli TaxID=363863 RepID=A0ABP7AHN2_9ACTN